MRAFLKRCLPSPVRSLLRASLHYTQRVLRWPIILCQVRGQRAKDQWTIFRSAVAAPFLGLQDLQRWQDPILLGDTKVEVPGIGRFALRRRTDDLWHVLPWREQSIANLMRNMLKPGDVFIDAGANIGVYTVLAARLVGPSGKVLSIEMMPDTANRLEAHIRMNRLANVQVIKNALSDVAGETLTATVQPGKHGQATIATDSSRYGLGNCLRVRSTTLDAITGKEAKVRLMKIDVEGAELRALMGAQMLLSKLDGLVYESWGCRRSELDPVDQLLKQAGFNLHQLDGNNWMAEKVSTR